MKKALILLVILLVACGKRGDPRPPVPLIPQATSDLVVTQRAGRIVLSWSYPALTTTGVSLQGIRRIVVYRYAQELPPSATTEPQQPPEPGALHAVEAFRKVPELTAVQFAKLSERVNSIESADVAGATIGARVVFDDTPPFVSSSGRPLRLTYGVVTEGLSGRSEPSNLISIVPLPVASPPPSLVATAAAEGIRLKWSTPEQSIVPGADPVIAGYNIYRGQGETFAREFETPVNKALIEGTSYTDVPTYGEHRYRVTAVAAREPQLESEPSPVATATFRDLVPPPPPATVSALVETAAVRLVWDAVDAPDLAGYVIYRAEGTGLETLREVGKFPLTGLITETNYSDPTVSVGISYRYEITAWDKSNNESAPVSTGWVLVSRTP
ncbi:MAG TPA: hypothetical protein VM779_04390 [Thermoanaerobaculia bacterium]|nr:hypothetical protein [Thermoanaerobaculia bacterium]